MEINSLEELIIKINEYYQKNTSLINIKDLFKFI